MTTTPAFSQSDDEIIGLIRKLGPGDLSIIVSAVKMDDAQMLTTEGTANDVLWSALARRGLMQQVPTPSNFPPELKTKLFAFTPQGQAQIPALLERPSAK